MNEGMKKIENWNEITRGLYRYVISSNICYEIHILTWNHKTDILSSNASVYITGELLYTGTLAACLEVAINDDKENNN